MSSVSKIVLQFFKIADCIATSVWVCTNKLPWNPPLPGKPLEPWFQITNNLQQKKPWKRGGKKAGLWGWSSGGGRGWLAGKIPCAHFPAQWTNPSPLPSPLPYPSPPYLASWNMIIIFAAALYSIYIIHGSHMKMLHEMCIINKT